MGNDERERLRDAAALVGKVGPGTTPNQLVAYNLAAARRLRGWTQDEAAVRLEQFLGERWSRATFSAAERSYDGGRVRNFDADDLVAFAQAFELPLAWFFLPPPGADRIVTRGQVLSKHGRRRVSHVWHPADMVELALNMEPDPAAAAALQERFSAALAGLADEELTESQAKARQATLLQLRQAARHVRNTFAHRAVDLRELADLLDKLASEPADAGAAQSTRRRT